MSGRRPFERPFVMRLYPEEKSRLYCRVQVWPTHDRLIAHLNRNHHAIGGTRFTKNTAAACSRHHVVSYRKEGRGCKSACFAVIDMFRGKIGMEVITHEIFHATIAWAARVGLPFGKLDTFECTPLEERITYAHGRMCAEFVHKGMRPGGIYTDSDTLRARLHES